MSAPRDERVLILGGGLAAVRTAQALRDHGHRGAVVLVSEEAEPPYDRPPLSKDALLGGVDPARVQLLTEQEYEQLEIELVLGDGAVRLDRRDREVVLASGRRLSYERLVVATGSRARRLAELRSAPDVHHLRTAEDCRRLGTALQPGAALAVIGGGFIGLEVAASALARGCSVTVVEAEPAPLVRVLGPTLASWLVDWHRTRGVDVRTGVAIAGEGEGRTGRLRLTDGALVDADAVLVGVGVTRDLDWLADAGLAVHVGLRCDGDGRTSASDVFGAGDIVCRHSDDHCSPVAHWTAAAESAARVARALLGHTQPAVMDEAFFWSHQGDLKLQSVGRWEAGATTSLVSGSLQSGRFVANHSVDDRLVGVLAANDPRGFLASRRALRDASSVPA